MRTMILIAAALMMTSGVAVDAKKKKGVPATATASADDANKVICRRYKVTGSLIETTRVCHTRDEWRRIISENRKDTEGMQEGRIEQPK
jgi:hypothetical protein